MNKESFIYLWYDAPNDMYYLGKHKGSPDDKYTHSSRVWEHFTKDNIPEGVSRRILAYGTDEEMCVLEHNLLVNRKKRCWDRYYNVGVGDPHHVDQWGKNNPMYGRTGENNPNWKGGVYVNDPVAYKAEYQKKNRENNKEEIKRKRRWRYLNIEKPRNDPAMWRRNAKKKAERQGEGTLDAFLK